ncbi:hypothetical protein A3B57_03680 [Microgenomates group bacterium RIFCSPLOWO2_01_FULL_47_10]|nr:MAG: hypothetical protein A3B57_03680 [Microgenomates group bacterium RIFCSPLOWO2_01_FULL_47_10]
MPKTNLTIDRLREVKTTNQILAILVVILALSLGVTVGKQKSWLKNRLPEVADARLFTEGTISLDKPNLTLARNLNQTIKARKTRWQFNPTPLEKAKLSQLLWAMQGITTDWGDRAVPTSREAYPLQVSVMIQRSTDVPAGLYLYDPGTHSLKTMQNFDPAKAGALFGSIPSLQQAGAILIISANTASLAEKYDQQDKPELAYLEAGHAAQNLMLEAEALGLGVNAITQFDDILPAYFQIPESEITIYLLPVGYPKEE